MPPGQGRIIGLDTGSRRIGVAVSDALGFTAQARGVIERTSLKKDLNEIKEWVSNEEAVKIVVGLPVNMNGSLGPQAKAALAFKELIQGELSVPVVTWDERLTSRAAEGILLEGDLSRAKRKAKIDSLAAQVMLQSYLESERAQRRRAEEKNKTV